jgi:hypothetical protein
MRRRDIALATTLVAAALLAAWLARPDEDTQPVLRLTRARAPAGGAPGLLTQPVRRAGTRPPAATPASEPDARERWPAGPLLRARAEDDPALPPERRPLDVVVVDSDGAPVPRALVVARWGEWHTRSFPTDTRGRAPMLVPPGSRFLEVVAQAGASTGSYAFVHFQPLSPGARHARIVLRRYGTVSGLVRWEGEAVSSGTVTVFRVRFDAPRDRAGNAFYDHPAQAGACGVKPDGTFSLQVPDDAPVTLVYAGEVAGRFVHALAPGLSAGARGLVLEAETLRHASALDLTVLAPDGRAAPGARVTCWPLGSTWPGATPHGARYDAVSDASGHVRFGGLDARAYVVQVAPDERARVPWGKGSTTALAGGEPVVLRLQGPTVQIEGTVEDADGRPVKGAWVCALRDGWYAACLGTDAQGRFRGCANVPAGTPLQVFARHPREDPTARAQDVDVRAGAGPLRLVLEEIGPLTARARQAHGSRGWSRTVIRRSPTALRLRGATTAGGGKAALKRR